MDQNPHMRPWYAQRLEAYRNRGPDRGPLPNVMLSIAAQPRTMAAAEAVLVVEEVAVVASPATVEAVMVSV